MSIKWRIAFSKGAGLLLVKSSNNLGNFGETFLSVDSFYVRFLIMDLVQTRGVLLIDHYWYEHTTHLLLLLLEIFH